MKEDVGVQKTLREGLSSNGTFSGWRQVSLKTIWDTDVGVTSRTDFFSYVSPGGRMSLRTGT